MWLTFDQVSLGYPPGRPVLEQIDLRLGPGLWVLTGPNGSGKSSLLRCAAGILRPQRGRLLCDGEEVWADSARFRWRLGYAPQELEELPDLTAGAYLRYLATLKGIRPEYQAGRAAEMLGLLHLDDQPLARCSGGMKRRLGLAAALLNDPDLLLLDEPLSGLDPWEKVFVRNLLSDLARDLIVLLSTHIPEEIDPIADGALQIAHGRVQKGVLCLDD